MAAHAPGVPTSPPAPLASPRSPRRDLDPQRHAKARQWLQQNLVRLDGAEDLDPKDLHKRYSNQIGLEALTSQELGKQLRAEFGNVEFKRCHRNNLYKGLTWKPLPTPSLSPSDAANEITDPSPPPAASETSLSLSQSSDEAAHGSAAAEGADRWPSSQNNSLSLPVGSKASRGNLTDLTPIASHSSSFLALATPPSPSHHVAGVLLTAPPLPVNVPVEPRSPPIPQAVPISPLQAPDLPQPSVRAQQLVLRRLRSFPTFGPQYSGLGDPSPAQLQQPPPANTHVSQADTPIRLRLPARQRAPRAPRSPALATPTLPPRPAFGCQLAALKSSVPTLRRVPRGARIQVAQALKVVLVEITTTNSIAAWEDLLLFPYSVLVVPSKEDRITNLTTWVKGKVRSWEQDRRAAVPQPRPRKIGKQVKHQFEGSKVEAKLADGDVRGALRLLESEDTIAPHSEETRAALLTKHPPHPEPTHYPPPPNPPVVIFPVSLEELLHALKTFAPGSAGGLDSLRPQILRDLTDATVGEAGTELAGAMIRFMDVVLQGAVPEATRPIFYGASLTPLRKKCGGIRPIAVGCTWRRLASKLVLFRISPDLFAYLEPHQLGVGTKAGAEIGAHAARAYYNSEHEGARVFLKLDFWNAFNEIRRDRLLTLVAARYPFAYPFVQQAYGASSDLFYFGSSAIQSRRGVMQGDPLGPALFAMVVQPVVEALQLEFNCWYLDDASLGDTPDRVLAALMEVLAREEETGLRLNPSKSELAILGAGEEERQRVREMFQAVAPGIVNLEPPAATLLGSPLTLPALEIVLGAKTAKMESLTPRLLQLTAHSAFFLLRASITLPRLVYFLRCAPAFKLRGMLEDYDRALKKLLEEVLNTSLCPSSWLQSSLPVRCGGLGVRQAVHTAIPCFLASVHACMEVSNRLLPGGMSILDGDVDDAIGQWELHVQPAVLPLAAMRTGQENWETPLLKLAQQHLLNSAPSDSDRARILASSCPEAGAWVNVLPSPPLGTLLDNGSFRIAVALRLGCEVVQPHACHCGAAVEPNGHHGLSCQRSAGRHSRHAAANDVIARALRSAEIPNVREPPGCSRADGKRPDGLTLVPWRRGRSLVWDFTCCDTFAPSHLSATSRHPGRAAEEAAVRKKKKYEFLGRTFEFVPVSVETGGAFDPEGLRLLRSIGTRVAAATGEKRAPGFLLQRVSLAVQRGNAASVLGTLPRGPQLEELFVL